MGATIVRTEGVGLTRDTQHLAWPDLRVEQGAWVALTGPSGAGKTTFLELLSGWALAEQGCVWVLGEDQRARREAERRRLRRQHIRWMNQGYTLIPHLDVRENVDLGCHVAGVTRDVDRRDDLLDCLGLTTYRSTRASELSEGERARVVLARTMMVQAPLLLLDEPTAALPASFTSMVVDALRSFCPTSTLVTATHDADLARAHDRIVALGGA